MTTPFRRSLPRVFALFLILPLALPGPAYALRKQQLQNSPPGLAQLTAGMEDTLSFAEPLETLAELAKAKPGRLYWIRRLPTGHALRKFLSNDKPKRDYEITAVKVEQEPVLLVEPILAGERTVCGEELYAAAYENRKRMTLVFQIRARHGADYPISEDFRLLVPSRGKGRPRMVMPKEIFIFGIRTSQLLGFGIKGPKAAGAIELSITRKGGNEIEGAIEGAGSLLLGELQEASFSKSYQLENWLRPVWRDQAPLKGRPVAQLFDALFSDSGVVEVAARDSQGQWIQFKSGLPLTDLFEVAGLTTEAATSTGGSVSIGSLLSGEHPLSAHLFAKEAQSLENQKGRPFLTDLSEIIATLEKRKRRYDEGEVTFETIPRSSRIIARYWNKSPRRSSAFPAVSKETIQNFFRSNEDPPGSGKIPPEIRAAIRKKIVEKIKSGGSFVAAAISTIRFNQTFSNRAFDDLEQLNQTLSGRKEIASHAAATGRTMSKKPEGHPDPYQELHELSLEIVKGWIVLAGEGQLVGKPRRVRLLDQGPKEGKLIASEGWVDLGHIRERLEQTGGYIQITFGGKGNPKGLKEGDIDVLISTEAKPKNVAGLVTMEVRLANLRAAQQRLKKENFSPSAGAEETLSFAEPLGTLAELAKAKPGKLYWIQRPPTGPELRGFVAGDGRRRYEIYGVMAKGIPVLVVEPIPQRESASCRGKLFQAVHRNRRALEVVFQIRTRLNSDYPVAADFESLVPLRRSAVPRDSFILGAETGQLTAFGIEGSKIADAVALSVMSKEGVQSEGTVRGTEGLSLGELQSARLPWDYQLRECLDLEWTSKGSSLANAPVTDLFDILSSDPGIAEVTALDFHGQWIRFGRELSLTDLFEEAGLIAEAAPGAEDPILGALISGKHPLSDFLQSHERAELERCERTGSFSGYPLARIIGVLRERQKLYESGVVTLGNLPRLPRVIVRYHEHDIKPFASLFPTVNIQGISEFCKVNWNPAGGGSIPPKRRKVLREKITKKLQKGNPSNAVAISTRKFNRAFNDLEQLIRALPQYDQIAATAGVAGRARQAQSWEGRGSQKRKKTLGKKWRAASIELVEHLILKAPDGENQPIGKNTHIRFLEQSKGRVGGIPDRLQGPAQLKDLLARLQGSPPRVLRVHLPTEGKSLLSQGNILLRILPMESQEREEGEVQQWLDDLKRFIDRDDLSAYFPKGTKPDTSAGLESTDGAAGMEQDDAGLDLELEILISSSADRVLRIEKAIAEKAEREGFPLSFPVWGLVDLQRIASSPFIGIAAKRKGTDEILGFVIYRIEKSLDPTWQTLTEAEFQIVNLGVHPEFQRRGVARWLIEQLKDRGRDLGRKENATAAITVELLLEDQQGAAFFRDGLEFHDAGSVAASKTQEGRLAVKLRFPVWAPPRPAAGMEENAKLEQCRVVLKDPTLSRSIREVLDDVGTIRPGTSWGVARFQGNLELMNVDIELNYPSSSELPDGQEIDGVANPGRMKIGDEVFLVRFKVERRMPVRLATEVEVRVSSSIGRVEWKTLPEILRSLGVRLDAARPGFDPFSTIPSGNVIYQPDSGGYGLTREDDLTYLAVDDRGGIIGVGVQPPTIHLPSGGNSPPLLQYHVNSIVPSLGPVDLTRRVVYYAESASGENVLAANLALDTQGHARVYIPRVNADWRGLAQTVLELSQWYETHLSVSSGDEMWTALSEWEQKLSPYFLIARIEGFERSAGMEETLKEALERTQHRGGPIQMVVEAFTHDRAEVVVLGEPPRLPRMNNPEYGAFLGEVVERAGREAGLGRLLIPQHPRVAWRIQETVRDWIASGIPDLQSYLKTIEPSEKVKDTEALTHFISENLPSHWVGAVRAAVESHVPVVGYNPMEGIDLNGMGVGNPRLKPFSRETERMMANRVGSESQAQVGGQKQVLVLSDARSASKNRALRRMGDLLQKDGLRVSCIWVGMGGDVQALQESGLAAVAVPGKGAQRVARMELFEDAPVEKPTRQIAVRAGNFDGLIYFRDPSDIPVRSKRPQVEQKAAQLTYPQALQILGEHTLSAVKVFGRPGTSAGGKSIEAVGLQGPIGERMFGDLTAEAFGAQAREGLLYDVVIEASPSSTWAGSELRAWVVAYPMDTRYIPSVKPLHHFGSLGAFMGRYEHLLKAQDLMAELKDMKAASMEVWVVRDRPSPDGAAVITFAKASSRFRQRRWRTAVQRKLPPLGSVTFPVGDYPAGGILATPPQVIIREAGARLRKEPHRDAVVVTLDNLKDVARFVTPGWIYALSVTKSFWGKELGPALLVLTFQNEQGETLHAIFA